MKKERREPAKRAGRMSTSERELRTMGLWQSSIGKPIGTNLQKTPMMCRMRQFQKGSRTWALGIETKAGPRFARNEGVSELSVLGGAELADDARAKFFGGRAAVAFDGAGERAGRVIAEVEGDLLDWSCGAGNEDGCNALDQ